MQLKELLSHLPDFKVLSGFNGLERNVLKMSVIETPDVADWMLGGELLITRGLAIKKQKINLYSLIKNLEKKLVAGLGIVGHSYINSLPSKLLELSNHINFPIILIPHDYPFSRIIDECLKIINYSDNKDIEDMKEIHYDFLYSGIIARKIDDVIKRLQSRLDVYVGYYDKQQNTVYETNVYFFVKADDGSYIPNYKEKNNNVMYKYIINEGTFYGILAIAQSSANLSPLESSAIESAEITIQLITQKRELEKHNKIKQRDDFIMRLISSEILSEDEIANKAEAFGWNLENKMRCAIFKTVPKCVVKEEKISTISHKFISKVRQIYELSYHIIQDDCIVFIFHDCNQSREMVKETFQKIISELKFDFPINLYANIGSKIDIKNISSSYEECKILLRLNIELLDRKVVIYDEISLYWDLFCFIQSNQTSEFPIIEKIKLLKKDNYDYYVTLKQLIKSNWQLKKTSENMYLHYNTIKYRRDKIIATLKINPEYWWDRLCLEIGVIIVDLKIPKICLHRNL